MSKGRPGRQRTYTVEGWAAKNFVYLDSNITNVSKVVNEVNVHFGQGCKSIWMFVIDNHSPSVQSKRSVLCCGCCIDQK